MKNKKEYKLVERLLKKSVASKWAWAKEEWFVDDVQMLDDGDDYETCTCGHYPIKEVIVIKNRFTGVYMAVGNCCINRVLTNEFNKLFAAVRKGKVNMILIHFAYKKGIIFDKEYIFMMQVWRNRVLSVKQLKWRDALIVRILKWFFIRNKLNMEELNGKKI